MYTYIYICIYTHMLSPPAMAGPASGRGGCIGARKSPAAVRHGICAWTRQASWSLEAEEISGKMLC